MASLRVGSGHLMHSNASFVTNNVNTAIASRDIQLDFLSPGESPVVVRASLSRWCWRCCRCWTWCCLCWWSTWTVTFWCMSGSFISASIIAGVDQPKIHLCINSSRTLCLAKELSTGMNPTDCLFLAHAPNQLQLICVPGCYLATVQHLVGQSWSNQRWFRCWAEKRHLMDGERTRMANQFN